MMSVRHTINKNDTIWIDSLSLDESATAEVVGDNPADYPDHEEFNAASRVLPTDITILVCKFMTYDEVAYLNRRCRFIPLDRMMFSVYAKKLMSMTTGLLVKKMAKDIVSQVPKYLIVLEDQYRFMGEKWNGTSMSFLEKRNRYQKVLQETLSCVLFAKPTKFDTLIAKMCRCCADGQYQFSFKLAIRVGTSAMMKTLQCDKFGYFDLLVLCQLDETGTPFYVSCSVSVGDPTTSESGSVVCDVW